MERKFKKLAQVLNENIEGPCRDKCKKKLQEELGVMDDQNEDTFRMLTPTKQNSDPTCTMTGMST